jgi:hypothetical protein
MAASEKPRLAVTEWVKGQPITYQCSECGQIFILPDDRRPRKRRPSFKRPFTNTLEKYTVMKRRIEDCLVMAKPCRLFSRYPEGEASCTLTTPERRKP